MPRQNITFTDPQNDYLTAEAARLGISVSDLVRRIIDAHREREAAKSKRRTAGGK